MTGEEGAPYCLPLSMVRPGGEPLFPLCLGGNQGWTCCGGQPVCVSFVAANQGAEDKFTTYYQSANVRGTAAEVEDEEEKILALRACVRS